MKKISLIVLLTVCLFAKQSLAGPTQPRPDYLDQPVQLKQIGEIKADEKYPLIIYLPFTTGSAERYFSLIGSYAGLSNYFAIIPQGTPEIKDYLPDFFSYLQWFEKRLMTDLNQMLKDYPIDPNQIYISGFSLGGDLSWALMIRHKELFAGVLILGSRCSYVPTQKDLIYLKEHKRRIVLLMGDKDLPDRRRGMINTANLAKKNGLDCWYWEFEGEHDITHKEDMIKAFDLMLGRSPGQTPATVRPSGF